VVYGPLACGATTLMYEGAPNWPEPDRFWDIIERHKVNTLYTAPTAIRAFIKWGEQWPLKHDLSSLRLLGTVGEPINPEAWMWYHRVIGKERCPIVDTWWQTETGAIMITPLPGATPTKPGSGTKSFPGIDADIMTRDGKPVGPNESISPATARARMKTATSGSWAASMTSLTLPAIALERRRLKARLSRTKPSPKPRSWRSRMI
jgi:acetyl-CoA synthetase